MRLLSQRALVVLIAAETVFAQRRPPNPCGQVAGCGVCGSVLLLPIILLALSIAMLIWVARDAKARGMDNAVVWMLVVFFLNVLGLVLYLFSRPAGNLIRCASCGNQRLQASAVCPHCGNA